MLFAPPLGECLKELPSPEFLKKRILMSTKPPKEYKESKHEHVVKKDGDVDEDDDEEDDDEKKGHNILLAQPNGEASGPLIKDASSVWFCDTLKLGGSPLIPNHATSHPTSSPAQPDDTDALSPSLKRQKCF
ncbi:hypothetical protein F2Q69_00027484 [Brassica cretica]|uniref:Uncharacterized protein n=1 Tax=Brassica cretica TaxID=69181 RepID=A0A8S9S0D2_BRACR|nr:hypothetical protein F2Q69_00027484 [Brassica cretica]